MEWLVGFFKAQLISVVIWVASNFPLTNYTVIVKSFLFRLEQ